MEGDVDAPAQVSPPEDCSIFVSRTPNSESFTLSVLSNLDQTPSSSLSYLGFDVVVTTPSSMLPASAPCSPPPAVAKLPRLPKTQEAPAPRQLPTPSSAPTPPQPWQHPPPSPFSTSKIMPTSTSMSTPALDSSSSCLDLKVASTLPSHNSNMGDVHPPRNHEDKGHKLRRVLSQSLHPSRLRLGVKENVPVDAGKGAGTGGRVGVRGSRSVGVGVGIEKRKGKDQDRDNDRKIEKGNEGLSATPSPSSRKKSSSTSFMIKSIFRQSTSRDKGSPNCREVNTIVASSSSVVVRRKKSTESQMSLLRFITIKPRVAGVFTPELPPELWLLILQYATSTPFVLGPPLPVSATGAAAMEQSPEDPAYPHSYPYTYPYHMPSESAGPPNGSSAPTSFLTHAPPHAHLPARLAQYKAHIRWKASLTRVCRVWNWVGQEVLYEYVWIGRGREARALAGRLCAEGAVGQVVHVSAGEKKAVDEKKKGWFGRAGRMINYGRRVAGTGKSTATAPTARPRARRPSPSSPPANVGRFIRRLHIETPSMEKCSPHDLLLILQYCPRLEVYSDYRSVRRPMHPLALSVSDVVPFSSSSVASSAVTYGQDLLTPDALLHTLLSPGRPLKKLSWTNYDYDGSDFVRGVQFYIDVVGPLLGGTNRAGKELEFLEISLSGSGLGMGARPEGVWGVGGMELDMALAAPGAAHILTGLTAQYTATSAGIDGFAYALDLPALQSLKVTLDNATFSVLSTWDMPLLTHLSVISADFGYAGAGFRRFFEVHGSKLHQLELGHSSGDIEEAWLTPPSTPSAAAGSVIPMSPADAPFQIPLHAWCPHLKEFICSADAEWNWQNPDWIAPHVLLPAHPGLQFIGVRDMERRLVGDADEAMRRRRGDVGLAALGGGGAGSAGADDDPYFMLLEQFGSLLRADAFPALLFVRDMSWESDVMRRTGRMGSGALPLFPSPSPSTTIHRLGSSVFVSPPSSSSKRKAAQAAAAAHAGEDALARVQGQKVLRFWAGVLEKCRQRGVWLEDCRGVNVTFGDLKRAAV